MAKEKIKTLDEFVAMIHKDYMELRKEMVTKGELKDILWPIQRDLKTVASQVGELRDDVRKAGIKHGRRTA